MDEKHLHQHGSEPVSDEPADEFEDDAAEGAASLIGMRIRRRSRRGGQQGFASPAAPRAPSGSQAGGPAGRAAQQQPAPQPAPAAARPQTQGPVVQAPAPAPGTQMRPQDIVRYWDQLRQGRRFPSRSDLDPAEIGRYWPNSMLVRRNRDNKGWQLETQFSGGLQAGSNGSAMSKGSGAECASMVTEWILSLGREVAKLGKPLQDTEVFPTSVGEVRYNVIALPLSENQNEIDHVLYHLVPANEEQ